MQILRTPEACREVPPGFCYVAIDVHARPDDGTALRVHCLDEQRRQVTPMVSRHGNPSWCDLDRQTKPGQHRTDQRVTVERSARFLEVES